MSIPSVIFYNTTMNCPTAQGFPDIFHVEGMAWEVVVQTGTLMAVNFIPQVLEAITKKVAVVAKDLHKSQVCGMLLTSDFKFNECFYTSRTICQILQSSVNTALQNWTNQCIHFVRAGMEALKNNTQPPPPAEGTCEDYKIQYPPLTEHQQLLETLQTEGNLAGTGPIERRSLGSHRNTV